MQTELPYVTSILQSYPDRLKNKKWHWLNSFPSFFKQLNYKGYSFSQDQNYQQQYDLKQFVDL